MNMNAEQSNFKRTRPLATRGGKTPKN